MLLKHQWDIPHDRLLRIWHLDMYTAISCKYSYQTAEKKIMILSSYPYNELLTLKVSGKGAMSYNDHLVTEKDLNLKSYKG